MNKIIFTRPDGGLSVLTPALGARLAYAVMLDGVDIARSNTPVAVERLSRRWASASFTVEWAETDAEFLARIGTKDVPNDATNVLVVDESEIPTDRTFRNALRAIGGTVSFDMTVSKMLARDILRAERRVRFRELDGQWMRAMGRKDSVTADAIEAKRETMRSWPTDTRIVDCATPGDLKALVELMKIEV